MITQTISIIGLNKVSASIALSLQRSDMELTIIGHDRDHSIAVEAKSKGLVNKTTRRLVSAASQADILIIDVPVDELEETIEVSVTEVQDHCLVVDLSNLKSRGLEFAQKYMVQGHYVGAKPILAADHLSDGRHDISAAAPDLFHRSVFCLMPSAKADPKAVETAVNLGRILGAQPFFIDAMEYDNLMQGSETIPGLVSAAIFQAISKSTGWRDMLRFSGLGFAQSTASINNPDLVNLTLHDRSATLRWLDAVFEELTRVRQWVADADEERFSFLIEELSIQRDEWLHERRENQWTEIDSTDMDKVGIVKQLFGFGFGKANDPSSRNKS